jgi:hypothetical protein
MVENAASSEWETIYIAMGSLLLALAIAIRLTKTSGEIQNEKKTP